MQLAKGQAQSKKCNYQRSKNLNMYLEDTLNPNHYVVKPAPVPTLFRLSLTVQSRSPVEEKDSPRQNSSIEPSYS
jgi:hypothetical protein